MSDTGLSNSQFHMWRALTALTHADGVVTTEERQFIEDAISCQRFSDHQIDMLKQDLDQPQDPLHMFTAIEDIADQEAFFTFAFDLVWSDGDYDNSEYEIMTSLQRALNRRKGLADVSDEDIVLELRDRKKLEGDFKDSLDRFSQYFGGTVAE